MAAITKIEWTDRTWNPVRGRSMAKGSETGGCLNCYAARMAARNLPEMKSPTTGQPFARMMESGPRWTGDLELIENALAWPLRWRKPMHIFVNSMSDLFHEDLPNEVIDRVFAVMAACPRHTFQVLTKRPERMLDYIIDRPLPPNLWLASGGESGDGRHADSASIADTGGNQVRFVRARLGSCRLHRDAFRNRLDHRRRRIGPGARLFDLSWARNVILQCRAAGASTFVKQLGANPGGLKLVDRKGGDWSEWPEDLRVRQFPHPE